MSSRSKTSSKRNGLNGNNGHSEETKAQWSTQSYSLEDLTKQFTLPQVVRCKSTIVTRKDNPLPVNLTQPMLLFETRTAKKLLARNVMYDQRIRKYNETDETIVIPQDYSGSFVRLKSRSAKDHTVHRSIDSLVSCKVSAFMNLTNTTTFHLPRHHRPATDYQRVEYVPGNIFISDKVIKGTAKVKADHKVRSPRPGTMVVQDLYYLKCRDERDNDVIIPTNHPGEFTEIMPNPFKNGRLSVKADDIITSQAFPMLLRYVYGAPKPRLTHFSGLLTALDSFEERGVVACVISSSGFTLIELPMSTTLNFQLALNSHDLFHIPLMKNAMKLCEKTAATFKKDLKYKFKFGQKTEDLSQTMLDQSIMADSYDNPPLTARSTTTNISTIMGENYDNPPLTARSTSTHISTSTRISTNKLSLSYGYFYM